MVPACDLALENGVGRGGGGCDVEVAAQSKKYGHRLLAAMSAQATFTLPVCATANRYLTLENGHNVGLQAPVSIKQALGLSIDTARRVCGDRHAR